MINVGIPVLFSGSHWMGGINYFNSLLSAINDLNSNTLKVFVLTNDALVFEKHASERIKIVALRDKANRSILKRIINKTFDFDINIRKFILEYEIDIVTHVQPSSFYKAETIWWKPDFQEKYLPEYFKEKDINLRNKAVLKSIRNKKIIFSSADAKNDFNKFYSNTDDVYAPLLRFVPFLNHSDLKSDPCFEQQVLEKYDLDKPFFFLPNQFWAHKNHELVFRAMKNISSDVYLVVTGSMNDYRNQDHIDVLKRLATESVDKIKMLGLISREEMLCLMKKSIAVINPSRFEGWSTTVEESKYLGKRMILSSLGVHFEQDPPESIFVGIDDVLAMSSAIDKIYAEFDIRSEIERKDKAEELYFQNKEKFAQEYVDLVLNVKKSINL